MLQSPIQPCASSSRIRRNYNQKSSSLLLCDTSKDEIILDPSLLGSCVNTVVTADQTVKSSTTTMPNYDDNDDAEGGGAIGKDGKRTKSRRELPAGAVATLKAWLLSPEHFTHPYPTPQDQAMLMQKTGIDKKQLKNWFTNARRRIWKPMLKKQIEQGKLTATAGAPCIPGHVPGLMIPSMPAAAQQAAANGGMDNPHSIQAMRVHYQQAVQQQQQDQTQQPQQQTVDAYGNAVYAPAPTQEVPANTYYGSQVDSSVQQQQQQAQTFGSQISTSGSVGTLPQLPPSLESATQLSKTDSHAVLMELFARDQDLVRQATESARLKAESSKKQSGQAQAQSSRQQPGQPEASQMQQVQSQHPMKAPAAQSSTTQSVPTLNSWPHFSSITSLNNLGTMPGVKSITSLSGADAIANKGSSNSISKRGNLAHVKSTESMGKNDSYAFLEVFFGDRSSQNLSALGGGRAGMGGGAKHSGAGGENEDNEIGLSLEDESPSQTSTPTVKKEFSGAPQPAPLAIASLSSPLKQQEEDDTGMTSGTLKRAYDDALAARGLISVSRSSEKLTDLVLPAKMQRTLSREFRCQTSGANTNVANNSNRSINNNELSSKQQQQQPWGYSSSQPVPQPAEGRSA